MKSAFARAQRGEPAAVAAIVEQLRPRLTRMAGYYARCASENADDLLQEAWLGMLDALRELDTEIGSPEQYLIQRARWRLLDAIKRGRVRRCLPLEEIMQESLTDPNWDQAQGRAAVADFARHLKATQLAVLECLLSGLTWREAGDRLGCSSANIAYHVRQIQRQYVMWEEGSLPGACAGERIRACAGERKSLASASLQAIREVKAHPKSSAFRKGGLRP